MDDVVGAGTDQHRHLHAVEVNGSSRAGRFSSYDSYYPHQRSHRYHLEKTTSELRQTVYMRY